MLYNPEEVYDKYVEKLQEYDLYSEELINELGEAIKIAPFTLTLRQGGAYPGALVSTIMNKLCVVGVMLNSFMGNETVDCENLKCDNRSLVRVLLIQHIAKAVMFESTSEQWKINKGDLYQFANSGVVLKLGERTVALCMKYGIKLTEPEIEALLVCDKDDVCTLHMSPMVNLVKMANQITLQHLIKNVA